MTHMSSWKTDFNFFRRSGSETLPRAFYGLTPGFYSDT